MPRPRAIAALLVSALLTQLFFAMPASAVARIWAARCCDADCPAKPSAAEGIECCAIGAAPSEDALPSSMQVDTGWVATISFELPAPHPAPIWHAPRPASARAAPLFLVQRSLQL